MLSTDQIHQQRNVNPQRKGMATAASSSSQDSKRNLIRQINSHEVAIAELNSVQEINKIAESKNLSTRSVYQQNGNIFFCTSIKAATAHEQRNLDLAKAELQKMNYA